MIDIIGYILIGIGFIDIAGTLIVASLAINKYGLKTVLSFKFRLTEISYEIIGDILVLVFIFAKLKG